MQRQSAEIRRKSARTPTETKTPDRVAGNPRRNALFGVISEMCVLRRLDGGGCSPAKPVSMPNSLLTGNFSGNFTILGHQERAPRQESPALQALLTKLSTRVNRERILKNREF